MKKLFIILSVVFSLAMVGNSFADTIAGSQAGASVTQIDKSSSKSTVYDRKFVNPGISPFPQTNGFFTAPTPDSSFRSIKDILRVFGDGTTLRITEGALGELAKGGDVDSHLQIVRGADQVPRIYTKKFEGDKWLTIGIEKPIFGENKKGETIVIGTERIEGLTVTGFIDAESDDAETNSLQVIGKTGLKTLADGNNFMIITAEGAHRKVEAEGFGIGTYTVYGGNWDGGKQSGAGGGGLGYAWNETGPEDRPWIQGYVGCKEDPKLQKQPEPKADVQTGNHKHS